MYSQENTHVLVGKDYRVTTLRYRVMVLLCYRVIILLRYRVIMLCCVSPSVTRFVRSCNLELEQYEGSPFS